MPRANRHHLPGCIWHITHRCHQREFQLKFVRDREGWKHWLHDARKRYGLTILNYMVTSNHIHLLAVAQRNWIRDRVEGGNRREPEWSESLAVGGEGFVPSVQARLGARVRFRKVVASGDQHLLREPRQPYKAHSGAEIEPPSLRNTLFGEDGG